MAVLLPDLWRFYFRICGAPTSGFVDFFSIFRMRDGFSITLLFDT
ncbi:hypothetical protein HMPREF0293_0279 [Corynebacterium glucuronolyticum ATCC 51866]|uniref:Uncharacterized protein n=1 Tax=Corynebacterium glucuronolyticum ATCC 51866 TaxID=548478 RepID=A0ABM9XSN8_9CORY|nr:hypothetical protein HMPREF0293_0279 [Corynebacterium glucuronolyticum ATCC 51866]